VALVALDFRAEATQANGLELRELLRPWLASAVVDKDAMTLTLGIRPVPADIGLFFSSAHPDEQEASPVIER